MNVVGINKDCVGCGACIDICPVNALKLEFNNNGFYQPKEIENLCNNCNKCIKICPALAKYDSKKMPDECYYAWNNDLETRINSTSGGVFSALAKNVLSQGGVVFGAEYDWNFHIRMNSTNNTTLEKLMQTKYCQSNYNHMYNKIRESLEQKKLF